VIALQRDSVPGLNARLPRRTSDFGPGLPHLSVADKFVRVRI
jgi:hypothetical protein